MQNYSRRNFIKSSAAVGAGLLIARVSHAQEIITEDDGTAVAMGYKADHTAVDVSVWTRKAGADGANQKCTSCALYQAVDGEYGNCPIFAGKLVHAEGWCNGYVPK